MVDWNTGKPNARLWVLRLLRDNFGPGDKLVEVEPFSPFMSSNPYVYSLAVVTQQGKRRILLVNKRDRPFEIFVSGATGGQEDYVDKSTAFNAPVSNKLTSDKSTLNGFSVAIVTLP